MRANSFFLLRTVFLLLIARRTATAVGAAGAAAAPAASGRGASTIAAAENTAAAADNTGSSSSSTSSSTTTPLPPPAKVFELDAKNFDGSIRDGNVWLVEFYAPWCSHCKRFAATYEEVAKKLHASPPAESRPDGKRVMVGKVDGAADRALAARFSVHGFPSFFLLDGWNVYQYEGKRSLEDLIDFCTEDYAEHEPIPFLNSPFGPMGQIRAAMMYAGTRVIMGYEHLVETKGYSKGAAALIMCGIGITVGLVAIIGIGLWMAGEKKVKDD